MGVRRFLYLLVFTLGLQLCCLAQGTIVSGEEGDLKDTINKTKVHYTVSLAGAARMVTWSAREYCGINWTGIPCATMGNTTAEGVVTYTFSKPIIGVDLFLCHVNMNGSIAPEKLIIEVNHGSPVMFVDSGTCAPWSVVGNIITSPSVEGGINAIVHLTSDSAFTVLHIRSSDNGNNGGCGTSFIESSLKQYITSTPFVVPPRETDDKKKKSK